MNIYLISTLRSSQMICSYRRDSCYRRDSRPLGVSTPLPHILVNTAVAIKSKLIHLLTFKWTLSLEKYSPDFNECLPNFHRHHWRQLDVKTFARWSLIMEKCYWTTRIIQIIPTSKSKVARSPIECSTQVVLHIQMKLTSAPVQTRHTEHGILPAGLVYLGTHIVVRQQSARRQPWGWRLNLFYMEPGGATPW